METIQEFLQVSGFEPTTFRPEQSSEDSTAFWDVSKFFWISFLSVAKAIRFGSKGNWLDILSYLVWISFLLYFLFQIRIIKSMLVQISPLPPRHTHLNKPSRIFVKGFQWVAASFNEYAILHHVEFLLDGLSYDGLCIPWNAMCCLAAHGTCHISSQ